MTEKILEVNNLVKVYDGTRAVNGVSFSILSGEIVGLLGPNGAGKTTTISMILGILEQTSGSIRIFGKELRKNREELLAVMNFAAIYAHLPGHLTVWQNLYIFGMLYGVGDLRPKIKSLLAEFNLEPFAHSRSGFLSSGEQTRLTLAKAFLNDPRLMLLDEPTASLDPHTSKIMRGKIREYARRTGASVLWTSHDMYEVEAVCDRILFVSHGKILLEGDPKTLPTSYGKKNLEELFIAIAQEPLSVHP